MRAQSPMPDGACSARSAGSSLTGRLLFLLLLAPAFTGCENPQEPLDRPAPTAPDAPLIADEHTLLLLPFNADLKGEEGEEPTEASGVTFEPGIAGSGALINGSDRLAPPDPGGCG